MPVDEETIVVTGSRLYSVWDWPFMEQRINQIPAGSWFDWSMFDFENLVPRSPAETFADQAIVHGNGFEPNNPDHQRWEAQTRQVLIRLYNAAHDGVEGTFRNSDGRLLTDNQLREFLSELKITLSTDPLRGEDGRPTSGSFIRGGNQQGGQVNDLQIDMDHSNATRLAEIFGSVDEALTFIVLHEVGHGLDQHHGVGLDVGTGERFANWAALELATLLGLPTPTQDEFNATTYQTWQPPSSSGTSDAGPVSLFAVYGSVGSDILVRDAGSLAGLAGSSGNDLYLVDRFTDGSSHLQDHTLITDSGGSDAIYITGYAHADTTLSRAGNDLILGWNDGSSVKISNAFLGETVENVIFADQSQAMSIAALCQEYYMYWG